MKIPTKKLKSGFEIPVLGLGTWTMGGDKNYNPKNDDEKDIQAIQNAIEKGITHIDIAQNYAEGHTEKLVGQAIKKYDRSKLFIVTKVDKHKLKYDEVLFSTEESLKRLDLNYADLLLIHAPSPEGVSIKETLKAFDHLVDEKLVKSIGVSNFSVSQFQEAQTYTSNKIITNQVHYGLNFQEPLQNNMLNFCQRNDIILTAWRPLEKGIILRESNPFLDKICAKYQKTRAQVALNWLIYQDNVVAISKMSSEEHLEENLDALCWQMSEEDFRDLRNNFSK